MHTINFGIDVTIDDILFNDIDMEIQTLHPNGIPWCGSKEKGYILLSTLIRACCVFYDFVFELTTRTFIIQFNFHIFLNYVFFGATCAQVYDFPFMHGFQALPLKFVKVQTNTSLLLRETKSCLNLC